MKTSYIFFFISVLAFINVTLANPTEKVEVTKKVSEKYTVAGTDKLDINHKYGKAEINTWDKDEITVDITFRAWARNEEKARKILEELDVKYGKVGSLISFETIVNSMNNNNDNTGFEINYVVFMPKTNPLKLGVKYGSAFIADFNGELDATIKYSKIRTNRLKGSKKYIEVAYGDIDAEEIEKSRLKVSYGSGRVRTLDVIDLDVAYSKFVADNANTVQIDLRYGELRLEEKVQHLSGKSAYSSVKVNTLTKSLSMDVKYAGSFDVRNIANGFQNIDLTGGYSSFDLTFDRSAHFDFKADVGYGNISNNLPNTEIVKQIESNYTSKTIEGYVGKKGGGSVKVSTRYGSIKFK